MAWPAIVVAVAHAVKWVLVTGPMWVKMAAWTAVSMLINMALAPSNKQERDDSISLGHQTTQGEGGAIQVVYGTNRAHANIVASYTDIGEYGMSNGFTFLGIEIATPSIMSTPVSRTILACFGEGPWEEPDDDTILINGRPISDIPGMAAQWSRGLVEQACLDDWTTFRQDYAVGQACLYNQPVTYTCTSTGWDEIEIHLLFPNGNYKMAKDGGIEHMSVETKIEIGDAIADTWQTLAQVEEKCRTNHALRLKYVASETYEGGAAFTVTPGMRPRVRVTRLSTDATESRYVNAFELATVQVHKNVGFTHPGMVLLSLSGVPTEVTANGINELSVMTTGRIVSDGDDGFDVSRYHADAIRDILTQPVIEGDGDGDAYEVNYYRGVDPTRLVGSGWADQKTLADTMVPDGLGGTEKLLQCDAVFDGSSNAHRATALLAAAGRCGIRYVGNAFGLWVEEEREPVGLLCDGNCERDSIVLSPVPHGSLAGEATASYRDATADYRVRSILVPDHEIDTLTTVDLDLHAVTRTTDAARLLRRELARNRLMDMTATVTSDLDSVQYEALDVVYLQIDGRSIGGRITAVDGTTVTVDRDISTAITGTDALVVQTRDSGEQAVQYVAVDTTDGTHEITIDGAWDTTPAVGDAFLFGPSDIEDDVFEIVGCTYNDDLHGSLELVRYVPALDDLDDVAPDVYIRQAISSLPSYRHLDPKPTLGGNAYNGVDFRIDNYAFNAVAPDKIAWESVTDEEDVKVGYVRFACEYYEPADDTEGTTDRYVYWDAASPDVFSTSNSLLDVEGCWLVAVNESGTPIYIGGTFIGDATTFAAKWSAVFNDDGNRPEDGADVTGDHQSDINLDNVGEGARYPKTLHEVFRDSAGDSADRWRHSGTEDVSIEAGGLSGGKFLRVGDNSGNDEAWLIYDTSIPFVPDSLYRVRCRIRQTEGTGTVYIGLAGRNGADDAWVNVNGDDAVGSQHYIAASGVSVGETWTVYTGYAKGHHTTGDAIAKPDPRSPAVIHEDVRFVRPMLIVNYEDAAGIVEIDEMLVDTLPDAVASVDLYARDFGAIGDGVNDDTGAVQLALDTAAASGVPLVLNAVPSHYRITDTLTIGDGVTPVVGLRIRGTGETKGPLVWDGSGTKNMLEIVSCSSLSMENVFFDGNDVAGVSGMLVTNGEDVPGMGLEFTQCTWKGFPVDGVVLEQDASPAPMDYVRFKTCTIGYNGTGLRIAGGARQIDYHNGAIVSNAEHGVSVEAGVFRGFDCIFGLNGYDFGEEEQTGSDLYLAGEIAAVQMFGGGSESLVILDGDWTEDAGWSRLLAPNLFIGFNQAPHDELGGEAAIDVCIDYDCARPLILTGCKLMGDVALGDKTTVVQSTMTDFYNYPRRAGEADPITGFTGHPERVNLLGRCDNTDGTGYLSAQTLLSDYFRVAEDGWQRGIEIKDGGGTVYRRIGFVDDIPDTYYARQGWIFFHVNPTASTPLGWICTESGDAGSETTKATFEPFGGGLIGVTTDAWAAANLLTATEAADVTDVLGLGSMAGQDADDVAITGGSISGLTSPLAIVDGGTGAATAADARSGLGVQQQLNATGTAKSSDYTIQAADNGAHFTNVGASGNTTLTLPEAVAGMRYAASRIASKVLWLKPASGEKFAGRAANDYIELGGDDVTVTVKCLVTGTWQVMSVHGTIVWLP